MVSELFICEECFFAYTNKKLAERCEAYCKKHKACSIEITKNAIGRLKENNYCSK